LAHKYRIFLTYGLPIFCGLLMTLASIISNIELPISSTLNSLLVETFQKTSEGKHVDDIVIVNISDFSPSQIKDQINILSKYRPAVIAVDYYSTRAVADKLIDYENLVLPIIPDKKFNLLFANNYITERAHYGLISVHSTSYFEPFYPINDSTLHSFASKVIEIYDKKAYERLVRRPRSLEIINYAGNTNNFIYLGDLTNLTSLEPLKQIKDKIVLVGYTGLRSEIPTAKDHYDSYETPRGEMFGVVLHANLIHTLRDNLIDATAWYWTLAISLFCSITCTTFTIWFRYKRKYIAIKLIQVLGLMLCFLLCVSALEYHQCFVDFGLISLHIVVVTEIAYFLARSERRNIHP
jgi:CHASE2 domain-containing sensor protein